MEYLQRLNQYLPEELRADLVSRELCPYLLYQLFPYLVTIAGGGWFGWVRKGRSPQERAEAVSRLRASRPNSAFVNEVLVRCPHPQAKLVVGVGPSESPALLIRVLHTEGRCPMNYQVGKEMEWSPEYLKKDNRFIREFPRLLWKAFAKNENFNPCQSTRSCYRRGVSTSHIESPCRYHKKPKTYSRKTFFAGGLCPAAFQAVYPWALALYYGSRQDGPHTIYCPAQPDSSVRILIARKRILPSFCHGLVMKSLALASRICHPVDPLLYSLIISISGSSCGTCIHTDEEEFALNMRNRDIMCPASAYSLYPYLCLSELGREHFQLAGGWHSYVCPDFVGTSYMFDRR